MKKIVTAFATIISAVLLFCCCNPHVNKNTPSVASPTPVPKPVPTASPKPEPSPEPPKAEPSFSLNELSSQEKAAGWQLLFDGVSSDGWHAYGSKTIGTAWKIANGTLYFDANKDGQPKTGGDIVSDKEYKNFELQLDWKIDKAGNSGVCIYVNEDKSRYASMWNSGPEIQIVDNEGHPDGKIFKHQAGDLYDMIAAKTHAEKPALQWNTYLIRCVNGKLDVYLNKVYIISTMLWDANWSALIANSKFKDMPGFGSFKIGRIGLQDHGNNVWFRNIKIREL